VAGRGGREIGLFMTRRIFVLLLLGALLSVSVASAHEIRPGFLELRQSSESRWDVSWKVPMRGELRLALDPILPAACAPITERSTVVGGGAMVERWTVECPDGLVGELIIDGLRVTLTDVLVRLQPSAGESRTILLRPTSPSVILGDDTGQGGGAFSYLRIGVQHILLGIDHLLFVLGLLLIVKDRWTLLKTITSFTIAHSITLGIATLGYASAPIPPLNAAIALSILFLGPEIVRTWRGQTSFTIRHPWVVAFAFGLLHGFGFASGLASLGLPSSEIPLALLLFNVGVEIGQLGFVLLVVALERSFAVLELRWPRWAELAPGYAVGSLGAYWFVQRTIMMLGGAP
jgi:hydrogenase/urease accessory protein HupE